MRYVLLFSIFLAALFASDPYKNITHYTLNNGVKVYLYPDTKSQNTVINVDVKVGMKSETKENAGISHLVEHIVFRDKRVEGRDYQDLFLKEGATYVNGYTQAYKTEYVTIIEPSKSYWIVEQFSQMLLDKEITAEDLDVERGALQVEIGEVTWADNVLPALHYGLEQLKNLFPPAMYFYQDEFGIDLEVQNYPRSIQRINNQNLSFDAVMAHYRDYYYPSNMTLSIAGNFELKKMQQTIEQYFDRFAKREGKSLENKQQKSAALNHRPYRRYDIGASRNRATLGAKFIVDDPTKVIILESYVKDLARRLEREFRNKNGESYAVQGYYDNYCDAAVVSVSFNAPHSAFDKNIAYAQNLITKEGNGALTDALIEEALKSSKKEYSALEHDAASLMNLLLHYQAFRTEHNVTQTPYTLLSAITPGVFREVVQSTFSPDNSYQVIMRDYHFFPYEAQLFFLLLSVITIFASYRFFSVNIPQRKIVIQRRLAGRFETFWIMLLSLFVSVVITEWVLYFIKQILPINALWANGYDAPVSYLIYLADFLIFLFVLYMVVKILFSWFYIKLFATHHTLAVVGAKSKYITIADIKSLEVVPYSPALWGRIHGMTLFFWKPLLKIVSHTDATIYLRSPHAHHLKSDLEFAVFEQERRSRGNSVSEQSDTAPAIKNPLA